MTGLFIRGLWGDSSITVHQKTLQDVSVTLHGNEPAPIEYFAYGRANADYIRKKGAKVTKLSKHPIIKFTDQRRRESSEKGRVNWGMNMWRHKLEIIRCALHTAAHVVWIDWDIRLNPELTEVPADFWDRMAAGQPIQGAIRIYRNAMFAHRRDYWGRRQIVHGGFYYFRGLDTINQIIEIFEQDYPLSLDEQAVGHWIEQRMGKWDAKEFREQGYRAYCYWTRSQFDKPETIVFANQGR
jgi:hypothetical protein